MHKTYFKMHEMYFKMLFFAEKCFYENLYANNV